MYVLTFDPPTDMILLVDPVTSYFYPDAGFAKDLFFSGHTSTLTLMVLLESNQFIRWSKVLITATVGWLLAWQHVHYTLDIIVAPFVSITVFYLVRKFLRISRQGSKDMKSVSQV